MKIAVVGSGLIGQAWAIVFARGGHEVKMWDGDPKAVTLAFRLIEEQVADLQAAGLITDPKGLIARISASATLEEVLQDVDYVQENLPERVEMKIEIFAKMDKLASPTTVLASSTSSIPASAFTENLPGRSRCLIAHPVNPPYLIPVVEI
ncbi:MAG: 3-hydroxyacyl-CoA dehydrogenase NAD-binding domain-containing protein, partial [Alcaligenaceae bacterium]